MPGIIVGVDGSGHSQRALEWAIKEAALRHVPLTVITVHEAIRGWFGSPVVFTGDAEQTEEVQQLVEAETGKVLAGLDGPKPESVTIRAVHGFTVDELLKAAKDADMIVLGSRGAGGFARLTLGSVTTQVAHHATCPVLIVPPQDRG